MTVRSKTTLWYLPEVPGKNPYGALFIQSLRAEGVEVVPLPYGHLFGLRALRERPDVIHFQFIAPYILPSQTPDSRWRALVKGTVFLVQVLLLRLRGCRIVWTVHDLLNHEKRLAGIEWFFSAVFTRLAHRLVMHSAFARTRVLQAFRLEDRTDKAAVVFHPNYIGAYPDRTSRREARHQLDVADGSVVFLSLGQIRPYKGLPELVQAFGASPATETARLYIAGEPVDRDLAEDLRRSAQAMTNIRIHDRFLEPHEVDLFLKASDVVVLPYRAILTSGAVLLAMSYGRPCVVPRIACLDEVLDEEGAFFYDPADPRGLEEALARALDSAGRLGEMGEHNLRRASGWSWPRAARMLVEIYDGILPGGARTAPASGSA